MSVNIDRINKRLKENYGSNLDGNPIFRVIWSDDQKEKRFGKFAEWYGKIFLREFSGLREVPKYRHIQHKWLLERWMPPVLAYTPEIPDTSQGSYEPIYVFQDVNGRPLPVLERFILEIIQCLFNPPLPGDKASKLKTEEDEARRKEEEQTLEEITEQGRTWIGHRLHSKEAIIKP